MEQNVGLCGTFIVQSEARPLKKTNYLSPLTRLMYTIIALFSGGSGLNHPQIGPFVLK